MICENYRFLREETHQKVFFFSGRTTKRGGVKPPKPLSKKQTFFHKRRNLRKKYEPLSSDTSPQVNCKVVSWLCLNYCYKTCIIWRYNWLMIYLMNVMMCCIMPKNYNLIFFGFKENKIFLYFY